MCEISRIGKKTNLDLIKKIVKKIHRDQLLILPNTNSGYGIGKKDSYCDENSPLNPVSLYGRLKLSLKK